MSKQTNGFFIVWTLPLCYSWCFPALEVSHQQLVKEESSSLLSEWVSAICRPACPSEDKQESELLQGTLMITCRASCFSSLLFTPARAFCWPADVRPRCFTTSAIWWTLLCKSFPKLTCIFSLGWPGGSRAPGHQKCCYYSSVCANVSLLVNQYLLKNYFSV